MSYETTACLLSLRSLIPCVGSAFLQAESILAIIVYQTSVCLQDLTVINRTPLELLAMKYTNYYGRSQEYSLQGL